jgi:transcriptional regulator with XRE-family HTH domain
MSNYSNRIKEIIKSNDLTVIGFCRRIGLNSSTTIRYIINENRRPSSKTVDKILEAFPEYTKDWLLYGVEPKKEAKKEVDSDDLTVTAQQIIGYFEKKQIEVENTFFEQGINALHTLSNKVDEEAQIVKDIGDHVNDNLNDVQNRLTRMERYILLLEKDAEKFVKQMDVLKPNK